MSAVIANARTSDPAIFGRVAVLLGGTSSEREVSLNSGSNVLEALRARGVDAQPVDGIAALAKALVAQQFDRVFNVLHGHNGGGEDGIVQGLMEAFGVPYTGSDIAWLGVEHGQDPYQTGVAVAGPVDTALRAVGCWRQRRGHSCRGTTARFTGHRQAGQ